MIDVFEPDSTIQFDFISSVSPDAAPTFSVTGIDKVTVINSFTAQQSDATHYYAIYTVPASEGIYLGKWTAQKTFNGSLRNFSKSFPFRAELPDQR